MENKYSLQNRISSIVSSKDLTENKIHYLKLLFDKYISLDDCNLNFYHMQKAKLLFRCGNIENSLKELNLIDKEMESKYYLLFKINIKLNNLKNAKLYLEKYEKVKEDNNINVNISLCLYLINKLNNKTSNIKLNDYYNGSNITDNYIKESLNKFVNLILTDNYIEAIKLLNKIQNYVNINDIPIDFTELLTLVNLILKPEQTKSIDELIKEANELIENNLINEAKIKIDTIKKHYNYYSQKQIVSFLENKLNEKNIYNNLSKKIKNQIEEYKKLGKLNYYFGDYYSSYQYFSAGLYLTSYNEFYYYMAKCLFFMDRQEEAAKMFLKYMKTGYNKKIKCYKYLSKCNYVYNYKEKRKFYNKYLLLKNSLYNKETNLEKYSDYTTDFLNQKETNNKSINEIIEEFDSYSNIDKLKYIKYLYQHNYKAIADKLYNKYNKEFKNDKSVKNEHLSLIKNKKLYINQGKYNC
jgi:hypothetical protein